MDILLKFLQTTGFGLMEPGNAMMIVIGLVFIALAIIKDYEPLLLLPIGFGVIVGNIPYLPDMMLGVYDPGGLVVSNGQVVTEQLASGVEQVKYNSGSVLAYIYFGVRYGIFPPLIFLGIGAMTDFSTMLSNPKLVLLGAAAQFGVFATFLGALWMGFTPAEAGAIGIIGGADGPTAIFLSSKLAEHMIGPIAIAAYSYMALVPVIQPPIMRLLTTREERLIRMKPPRHVSKRERILFPIVAFLICALIAPGAMVLLGMLFFGNLLKESGVTERLANTARTSLIDSVTMLLGFAVGASTKAQTFSDAQFVADLRSWCGIVCSRHGGGCVVREADECISDGEDQPADWCRRSLGRSRFGTCRPHGWATGRSSQFPFDACHGTQRCWSHRIGRRGRCLMVRSSEVTLHSEFSDGKASQIHVYGVPGWVPIRLRGARLYQRFLTRVGSGSRCRDSLLRSWRRGAVPIVVLLLQ